MSTEVGIVSGDVVTPEYVFKILDQVGGKRVPPEKINDAFKLLDILEARLKNYQKYKSQYLSEEVNEAVERQHQTAPLDSSDGVGFVVFPLVWGLVAVYTFNSWHPILAILGTLIGGTIIASICTFIANNMARSSSLQIQEAETTRLRRKAQEEEVEVQKQRQLLDYKCDKGYTKISGLKEGLRANIKTDLERLIRRSHELLSMASYEFSYDTDLDDVETKGKPRLKWYSPSLTIGDDQFINSEGEFVMDKQALTTLGTGKLFPFMEDGIASDIKIYSNTGGIIQENYAKHATLIHQSDLANEEEFTDHSAQYGQTVCYYIILENRYMVTLPQSKDAYVTQERIDEHVIAKQRITIPQFYSEAEKLDRDIADRTVRIKREKFEDQVERSTAQATGANNDPELAEQAILEKVEAQRLRREKIKSSEERIKALMQEQGASQVEIAEALEEFHIRVHA